MTMSPEVPRRWHWLFRKFCGYVRRMLRKNFHGVRLSRSSAPLPKDDQPLIVVLNHPSWWDPLVCVPLIEFFPRHEHFAAIHAGAVQKYRILTRLGFFPVDTQSLRGAAEFLKRAQAILAAPGRAIWITAQGEFADVRSRPVALKPGVGHLAARLQTGWILPLAIEYCFWNERTPEALLRFGEALRIAPPDPHAPLGLHQQARDWTARIEAAMTANQDALACEAQARKPVLFKELVHGRTGAGGMYDFFRRLGCWIRLKRFDPSHASATAETPA